MCGWIVSLCNGVCWVLCFLSDFVMREVVSVGVLVVR